MSIIFKISDNSSIQLHILEDEIYKFTECELLYMDNNRKICLSNDYLYVYVNNMLSRLQNIPILDGCSNCFGRLGRWQEYYYDELLIGEFSDEIKLMEKATFISTENYGIFLYSFDNKIWLEMNRGYDENCSMDAIQFYSNSDNYRMLLVSLSKDILVEWERKLIRYYRMINS